MKNGNIEVFPCYSIPLMQFLTKEKGIRYLIVGLNQYNHDKFWLFAQSERLGEALVEWRERRPSKQ